jgi:amidase
MGCGVRGSVGPYSLPRLAIVTAVIVSVMSSPSVSSAAFGTSFHLLDATIDEVQSAISSHQLTCVELVELYLARIKAYNGSCVSPTTSAGQLGPVNLIPNAGQVNALMTLNLRPAHRIAFGSTHIMPGVRPTSLMMIRICRMRLK